MGVRERVAAAIDAAAIDGVAGSVWPPTTKVAGLCWAQWASGTPTQYANAAVDLDLEWEVLLTLPADTPEKTATAMDGWLPPVLAALSPLGRLGACTPVAVAVAEGGTVPAISIKLTSGGT